MTNIPNDEVLPTIDQELSANLAQGQEPEAAPVEQEGEVIVDEKARAGAVLVVGDPLIGIVAPKELLGIEESKELVSAVLQATMLDKNRDGKVTTAEIFASVSGFIPSLFNIDDVIDEVRDLSDEEVALLIDHVEKHFPDYTSIRSEVEAVIRQIFKIVKELVVLFQKIKAAKLPPTV